MRHRILVGCLILMTTLLILAGCGSGSSNDEAANDEATDVSQEIQTEDTSSRWYTDEELEMLADSSDRLYHSTGGVRDEQFPEYHQNALDLLEKLATYVPDLLKKEEFFHKAFFE